MNQDLLDITIRLSRSVSDQQEIPFSADAEQSTDLMVIENFMRPRRIFVERKDPEIGQFYVKSKRDFVLIQPDFQCRYVCDNQVLPFLLRVLYGSDP